MKYYKPLTMDTQPPVYNAVFPCNQVVDCAVVCTNQTEL